MGGPHFCLKQTKMGRYVRGYAIASAMPGAWLSPLPALPQETTQKNSFFIKKTILKIQLHSLSN